MTALDGGVSPTDVVLVDDDRSAAHALAYILVDEGFLVRVAHDGLAALGLLHEEPSDLLLSDTRMPGMDGFELLRHVRTLFPEVAVILMVNDSASEQRARSEGAHGHVYKPLDVPGLLRTIHGTLALARPPAGA